MNPNFQYIRSKRKTLCITITKDASVVVRAPLRMPQKTIDAFVQKQQAWIDTHLQQEQARIAAQKNLTYQDGEHIPFLGRQLMLKTADLPEVTLSQQDRLLLPVDCADRQAIVQAFLRRQAALYLPERVDYYATQMGVSPTGLRITSAKTRWGSCSGKNSLCFSFRLICLPLDLVDAVVVHELAHIRQKNHSRHFYKEIEAVLPDYQARRLALREAARQLPL